MCTHTYLFVPVHTCICPLGHCYEYFYFFIFNNNDYECTLSDEVVIIASTGTQPELYFCKIEYQNHYSLQEDVQYFVALEYLL